MAIKKYTAVKDNVISTALKANLSSSAKASNMGSSDILEIFSIFGQANSASIEKSRVLVQFPINEISADRDASRIPEVGSVNFVVRIGNAEHGQTTPEIYDLSAHTLLQPWNEGYGLDMEEYRDAGASNWISRSQGLVWNNTGSDFVNTQRVTYEQIPLHYTQSFTSPTQDIEIDATGLIEEWIKGHKATAVAASGGVTFHSSSKPANNSWIQLYSYGGKKRKFVFTHTNSTGSSADGTVYVLTGATTARTVVNFTASVLTHFAGEIHCTASETHKVKFIQLTAGFPGNTQISQSNTLTNLTAFSSSFAGGVGAQNYGFLLKLSGTYEDSSRERSFYTKKLFSRSSHHFFERPIIEARWDKSIKDDRYYVFRSSSLAPQADNLNTIFLYNKQRNGLVDLPDTGSHLLVQLYPSIGSGISPVTLPVDHTNVNTGATTYITASRHEKGIYKATFSCDNTGSTFYDVWQKSTGNGGSRIYTALVTGSGFTLKDLSAGFYFDDPKYNIKITNLKPAYSVDEKITFRVYMRNKNFQPNIYTVASNTAPVHFFRNGYYRLDRVADNHNVIAYSTGSTPSYSSLSYDVSGSFFDLDMSILEPNYLYQISFLQKDGNNYIEQKEKFKFRVDP